MALTPENIVQMAVANLGETTTVNSISTPVTKAEKFGALYYSLVRDRILAKHNWSWATRRATLTDVTATEARSGWTYAYTLPSDLLRFIDIDLGYRSGPDAPGLDPQNPTLPGASWALEMNMAGTGRVLLSDIKGAIGVYTAQVTNLALWQPEPLDALIWNLSASLSMPLSAKPEFAQLSQAMAERVLLRAIANDSNESKPDHISTSEIITARSVGTTPYVTTGLVL